jgi:tetratricopeptide (TPR) repeat protein
MGVVWQAWDPALERGLAIKLLRAEITDDHGRARFQREARALAKLQDPNVVAIHDVGEIDGEVFIATELIDGEPLDRWHVGRPPAEVIAAYAQAARGLYAAHQLGLVHRDVKPSNILVGRDGRARIGDFGLATRDPSSAPTDPGGRRAADSRLTEHGGVVGTPAYMAPEQRAGRTVDARADQFSLCLSLAEALTGERPDAGVTAAELAAKGVVAPWPAIARGLATKPADRYPDLAPIIAALDGREAKPRRGLVIAAVGGAAIVCAFGVFALSPSQDDAALVCARRQPLAGVWDRAQHDEITAAFAATKLAYAGDAATATIAGLDAKAADFVAADRRACEEAVAHPSTEVVAHRTACIAQVRAQLQALVRALATKPDAGMIQRASAGARGLPDPAICNAAATLAEQTVPTQSDLPTQGDAVSTGVIRAATLRRLGKLAAARTVIDAAVANAKGSGRLPAIAEAQHELGTVMHAQNDPATEKALVDALAAAETAHLDLRAAQVSALLVEVVGSHGDVAAAERQASLARTAILRVGGDRHVDAVIERGLGRASFEAKHFAAAFDHYKRAEAIHDALGERDDVDFDRRAEVTALGSLDRIDEATAINTQVLASDRVNLGPKHPKTISDLTAAGLVLFRAGRIAAATPLLEAASILDDDVSGPSSVHAAASRGRLASAYMAAGRLDEAERLDRDVVGALAASVPANDQELRGQRMNLAGIQILLGHYADAEAALEALADAARASGDTENLGLVEQNLAEALYRDGKLDRALATARNAASHDLAVFGPLSRRGAEADVTLGNILVARHDPAAASELEQAIHTFEKVIGPDTAELGEPLTSLAELQLARGDGATARSLVERAIRVAGVDGDPADVARSRFVHARALAAAHDPAAIAEAKTASELYRRAGPRSRTQKAAVDAWLTSR